MPNIKTYDQPALEIRPTEVGVHATEAAARRGGAFFNQAAAAQRDIGQRLGSVVSIAGDMAVKYLEHRELSAGAANFAQMQDGLLNAWNKTAKEADPNNPSTAAEFRAGMEPSLEKFKQSFVTEGGQRWAQAHTDRLREHMFHKTSADMSSMAATAVQQNALKTVNSLGNTTYNDPSSLSLARDTLKGTVEGLIGTSPNMGAVQAAKVREDLLTKGEGHIVNQAVRGAIARGGDWQRLADDPKNAPFLDRAEIDAAARTQERARRVDESYQRTLDERARTQASDNRSVEILQALRDKPGSVSAREVLNDPALSRSDKEHMVGIIDRTAKPEALARASHETTIDLLTKMRARDETRLITNDPIYQAYQDGKLNNADFNFLNNEFRNLRTPEGAALEKTRGEFVKRFAQVIDGNMTMTGQHSLLGTQRLYDFEMDARRSEAALRQKGLDPHLVYDPRSEYFWGRPENIARYHASMQEAQAYEKTFKAMHKENATPPPAPDKSTAFVPPADWQWSPSRRQYRDPSGQIYDPAGKRVKQ